MTTVYEVQLPLPRPPQFLVQLLHTTHLQPLEVGSIGYLVDIVRREQLRLLYIKRAEQADKQRMLLELRWRYSVFYSHIFKPLHSVCIAKQQMHLELMLLHSGK